MRSSRCCRRSCPSRESPERAGDRLSQKGIDELDPFHVSRMVFAAAQSCKRLRWCIHVHMRYPYTRSTRSHPFLPDQSDKKTLPFFDLFLALSVRQAATQSVSTTLSRFLWFHDSRELWQVCHRNVTSPPPTAQLSVVNDITTGSGHE